MNGGNRSRTVAYPSEGQDAPREGAGSHDPLFPAVLVWLVLVCVFLFGCGRAAAAPHTVQSVPNVQLGDRGSFVSDPDKLLTPDDVRAINRSAEDLRCRTGVELAVVALRDIGEQDAREFATSLFNAWGLGQKGKDNGLLIQLVTEPPQRSVVFETGYGLEGVLPDAISFRLQRRYMVPDMSEGRFGEGLRKGVVAVHDYLLANEDVRAEMAAPLPDEHDPLLPRILAPLVLIGLFILFRRNPALLAVLLSLLSRGSGGGGFGGGSSGGSWGGGRSGGGSISRF
jgi:Beta-propeller domains of methanol dehydrogenase type